MRFQVLGPLRVTAGGEDLPLGGPQQRLVLALLIAARGRTVSTDSLIEGVWGEDLPPTGRKAIQGYIHHLRGEIGESLATQTGGYSLDAGEDVDAIEFEELRTKAADLLGSDPETSANLLRQALELWNGPAYADLSDQHALLPEVARLENLRLAAVGDRIDADLALGRHETLVGELEGLTLEHPFQERFWAQHMTALFRAGRQTEALRSYERLRRFLADESGLEPSEQLKQLEERILAQDRTLAFDAETDAATDPAAIRGYELREKVSSDDVSETYRAYQRSVGRQVAIRIIGPRLANDPVFISNFLADTQRVAAVDHPHISYVFDTWREPGNAFQVSRWLGGGTLEESAPGGLRATLAILGNVGDALSHAHRHGVAHGSVDASHVLFDDAGHSYLGGFSVGLAKTEDDVVGDRLDFAVMAHEVIGGRSPRHVDGSWVPDLDETALVPVFEVALSKDGYGRVDDFLRALRQAAGADVVASTPEAAPRTDLRNPYKGLKAFQEADADDFYGREELVDRLTDVLERRRLIAIVGPSGSGKSSLVKAGLLPRLRSDAGSRLFTEMYPGAFPFEELEGALSRVGIDRRSVIDDLVSDDRGLLRVLKRILPSDDAELVLVIDQFEELFSTVEDEGTRRLFLDSLVTAISEPHSRLRVVITLRADFFDRPLQHARFGELVEAGLVPVKVPDDDQLAQATVMPARSEGVEFEDGLVSQIVSDVEGQPGGLPLLQYALTELFESRDSDRLSLAAYQRSGGVHGALGRRAEELYEGLNAREKASIREAFLRMVTVDENADDLRRRVRRSDLSGIGNQKDLDNALQAYAAARLITFDRDPVTRGPTIEVAHEALLREWPRLRDWIEEQRDDLVIRRRLDAALEEWKQSGEDGGYLPTGSRLAQFEEWAGETELALSGPERAFLQAGVELEATRRARASRRRRWIMTGFGVAAVVAFVFGLLALRNADTARAEALAAAAIEQIDEDPERSVLLAMQSLEIAETPNGLTALHQALQSHRTLWANQKECEFCGEFEALHPDGTHVLTVTSQGSARYWDTSRGDAEPIWTQELTDGASANYSRGWIDLEENQITIPVSDLGTPDLGFTESAEGAHRGLYTLDLASGDVVEYQHIEGCVAYPFFPPFASQTRPALGFVLYPEVGDEPDQCDVLATPQFLVRPDAFESDSIMLRLPDRAWAGSDWWWDLSQDSRLLTFSSSEGAYVLDARTGQVIEEYPEYWRATLSPDNQEILLYAHEGAHIDLRSFETNELLNRYPGPISWMRFAPDGDTLYGLSLARGVEVFEPESGRRILELAGPETRAVGMRFGGQDERILVATPVDRRLWNVQANLSELPPTPPRVMPHGDFFPDIAGITIAGGLMLVPGFDGEPFGYALYEAATGRLVRESRSLWAFLSPDGTVMLEVPLEATDVESPSGFLSGLAGHLQLVGARTGDLIQMLDSTCPFYVGNTEPVFEGTSDCEEDDLILPLSDAEFSDSGEVLAVAAANGAQAVFDLSSNEVILHRQSPTNQGWAPSIAIDANGIFVVYQQGEPPFTITAVDLESGEVLGSLEACNPNSEMVFSADETKLYTADWCSDVVVIDTGNWEEVARFGRGQGGGLDDLAVSGVLGASVGSDNVLRVWNLESGDVLLEVTLSSRVGNVEFIDETHVMAVSLEGEVLVFTLDPDELKSIALDRLTRGLTEEECAIYDIDPCPTLEEMGVG